MRNNAAHFGFMNDAFCAHMLPVKRCPLFACSGHFRVIVTHSDTLKEMDCSGPGGPRGDHPLRHSRGHYLSAPSKATFKRCRQTLRWRQMLCFATETFPFFLLLLLHFTESIRGSEKEAISVATV